MTQYEADLLLLPAALQSCLCCVFMMAKLCGIESCVVVRVLARGTGNGIVGPCCLFLALLWALPIACGPFPAAAQHPIEKAEAPQATSHGALTSLSWRWCGLPISSSCVLNELVIM